jgi:hypothetical protein
MAQDSSIDYEHRRRPLAVALGAVLAAVSAYMLPAVDAILPGGAILWQSVVLVIAVGCAGWAYRSANSPANVPVWTRRWVRLMAVAALLLVLVWMGGVGALWLLWPR